MVQYCVYLDYLWVIVLCCQRKSCLFVLALNDNSSVLSYEHGFPFQQKFKAFYLPILSSCKQRSVGMNVLSLFISTTVS